MKLQVKDKCGNYREMNKCLYFAEGVLSTLVSLGALKNFLCVSRNLPYPEVESASSLTDRDDRDDEEDEKEEVIKSSPDKAEEIPFPPLEENVPKLRAWLVEKFSASSFNTSSAPLAKMTGAPMKWLGWEEKLEGCLLRWRKESGSKRMR